MLHFHHILYFFLLVDFIFSGIRSCSFGSVHSESHVSPGKCQVTDSRLLFHRRQTKIILPTEKLNNYAYELKGLWKNYVTTYMRANLHA